MDGKFDLLGLVLRAGAGLGSAERAGVFRSADVELIIVGGEGLESSCLNLVV